MNFKSQKYFLLSFLVFSQCIIAQTKLKNEKYLSFGLNAGMIGRSPVKIEADNNTYFHRAMNFGAGMLTDNSGNKRFSIIANTSIGAHFGFMWKDKKKRNFTGIHFEFQKNKACYSYNQPFKYGFKGDTTLRWVEADNYLKYSISLQRTWRFDKSPTFDDNCWFGKLSFGQSFMHTNFGTPMAVGHAEDWTENGTGMKLKITSSNKTSNVISAEIGRRHLYDNNSMLDIGIVYHAPLTYSWIEEYEFFKSGTSVGKSKFTYTGATVMLNLTYTYNYKFKAKPIDSTKFNDLAEEEILDTIGTKNHHSGFKNHKVNGRKYAIQKTINTDKEILTISVWDKNKVDGDIISLYLNGELILENFTVSHTKKDIEIQLKPGSNILVMHALNLGRVPPNTAALSFFDNGKKKVITLVSDLKKSGALELIYNP